MEPTKLKTLKDLFWVKPEIYNGKIDFMEKCGCDEEGEQEDLFGSEEIINEKQLVLKEELRQVVIEWIKEFDKIKDGNTYCLKCKKEHLGHKYWDKCKDHIVLYKDSNIKENDITGIIEFIKLFFNISEKNLK